MFQGPSYPQANCAVHTEQDTGTQGPSWAPGTCNVKTAGAEEKSERYKKTLGQVCISHYFPKPSQIPFV